MTGAEYSVFLQETCSKMISISKAKNADYTGGGEDAFANFTRVEAMGICTTEQGFLTRMTDKMSRIASFVKNGNLQVKDESVQDTLIDLANYSILMLGYLESEKRKRLNATTNKAVSLDACHPTGDFESLDVVRNGGTLL